MSPVLYSPSRVAKILRTAARDLRWRDGQPINCRVEIFTRSEPLRADTYEEAIEMAFRGDTTDQIRLLEAAQMLEYRVDGCIFHMALYLDELLVVEPYWVHNGEPYWIGHAHVTGV